MSFADDSRCDYWTRGECRSCDLAIPDYRHHLTRVSEATRSALPRIDESAWLPPQASRQWGFRNKAKLAIGGRAGAVTLGIQRRHATRSEATRTPVRHEVWQGVDLSHCPLYDEAMRQVIAHTAQWLNHMRITPYDIGTREGETKYVLITESPQRRFMVRVVVRSEVVIDTIRHHVDALITGAPHPIDVISVNIQPEPTAIIEGDRDVTLVGDMLAMPLALDDTTINLWLPPGAFFQTNTDVARALYTQAKRWCAALHPTTAIDLFCGVGGFALAVSEHCATVSGVEVSRPAIAAAQRAHRSISTPHQADMSFRAGDAIALADETVESIGGDLDLLIVNPPRRGITSLTEWVERTHPRALIYSSCNPVSLAADLNRLPSYRVRRARVFDMFPWTSHAEVMVLATRVTA